MELFGDLEIHNIWEEPSADLLAGVIMLWEETGALPPGADPERRAAQVLFAVRNAAGKVVAVSTAYKQYNQRLDNVFYYYRTLVSGEARRSGLARELMHRTQAYLESVYERRDPECIGIFVEVSSKILKSQRTEAIWPTTKFVFIGRNQRGDHLRVYYFPGVKIVQERNEPPASAK